MIKKHSFMKLTSLLALILTLTYLLIACAPVVTDTDSSTITESSTDTESNSESDKESDSNLETDSSVEDDNDTEVDSEPDNTDEDVETETETNIMGGNDTSTETGTDTDVVEHEHSFESTLIVAPQCTQDGYTVFECTCGSSYIDDITASTGHSYGDWTVSIPPNSSNDGEKARVCSKCGNHEYETIPKTILYYKYTVENGENVLRIDSPDKTIYTCYLETPTVIGNKVDNSNIDKVIFGENIVEVINASYFTSASSFVFSKDVESIGDFCIYNCEALKEIHFEGNAPKAGARSFVINGGVTITLIPSEDSEGFGDGLFFAGQPLYRKNAITEIPDLSLNEYAEKTATESVELAKRLVALFNEKGQSDLLIIPYTINMEQYIEIKNFTLELTKDCTTEIEKAEVIYDYITQNIVYDDGATFFSPYEVFKQKRAVCAGYVGLMHDMLSAVDIPAFYTRGMTLFGNTESLENILKETFTFDTHAWLTVCLSSGEVLFYDPTWGVEANENYKSMDETELGSHAMTFEVSGLQVLIDEIDFSMLGGGHQFLHSDGKIYNTTEGKLTLISGTTTINDWYLDVVEMMQANSSQKYTDGSTQDVGTAMTDGLYYFDGLTASNYSFATADGKIYHTNLIFDFLKTQSTVFEKEITLEIDGLIYSNGFVFAKEDENNYRALAYLGDATEITIPATIFNHNVLSVCAGFLEYNSTVKRVIVSNGIENIARTAFSKCSSLEYVYLPETVNEFVSNQYIGFKDCVNLKEIVVDPANPYMVSVDGNLYNKDMSVIIQYAPANTFETFTLPTSVVTIAESAFCESKLEGIILHDGLKEIKQFAFQYSSLKEITIPKNCEIGPSAFAYSDLESVVIEDGIEGFGSSAFFLCQRLRSVTLPSTLKVIPETAFSQATSLYQIALPQGIEVIKYGAFYYSGLTSITLSSAPQILDSAFDGCYRLYHINNLGSLELTKESTDYGSIAEHALSISTEVDNTRIELVDDFIFYVGDEKSYLTHYIGNEKNLVLPNDFDSSAYEISPYAFVGSSNFKWVTLTTITEPWVNELECVGKYIESITIPNTITYIPEYVFEGWNSLNTIHFTGTEEEWESISIDSLGNTKLLNSTILFEPNE